MNKIYYFVCLVFFLFILSSCSRNSDPDRAAELRAKSTARGDIIQRSGTTLVGDEEAVFNDAENRLRTETAGIIACHLLNLINIYD